MTMIGKSQFDRPGIFLRKTIGTSQAERKKPRSLKSHHTITLWEIKGKIPNQITSVEMNPGTPGKLDGEFRYLELDGEFEFHRGRKYLLTMTTKAGDGVHFHDHVAYDGLSPVINP